MVVWEVLVNERHLPSEKRLMTSGMRSSLAAKVFPPIFNSRLDFGAFALSLWASHAIISPFVFGPVDMLTYE